jgi:conjugal transfer ATP-binding protein TraC
MPLPQIRCLTTIPCHGFKYLSFRSIEEIIMLKIIKQKDQTLHHEKVEALLDLLSVYQRFELSAEKQAKSHFILAESDEKSVYGGAVCINPFSAIPSQDSEAASDALAMLKPILSLMAAPKEATRDIENAYLEQAIQEAWRRRRNRATITDVAKVLLAHYDEVAKSLGQRLHPYREKGTYGRFFNGPANIDLSSRLVVVELEELKERKDLQSVIVQMVILQITNSIYLGDRKTPSCLILDEAWDMLRGAQSGVFIETAARRLRKYFGGLVVGTQSINDFYANPGAQAAFDNADWMCLLSQKDESIELLKNSKRLMMDPNMERTLRSLRTEQGKYAEIMIKGPKGFAVGRLILDEFSKILYSTKADEFAAVQDLVSQGLSLKEAIQRIARQP